MKITGGTSMGHTACLEEKMSIVLSCELSSETAALPQPGQVYVTSRRY